jgi:hypothetical protein
MATGGVEVLDLGFVATEAITKYRFVKGDVGGERFLDMCDAQGEAALGVAQHDVSAGDAAEGAHVNVRLMGISVIEASAAIAQFAQVTTGTAGKAETAAAGDRVLGVALMAATADTDLITVALTGPAGQPIVV